MRNVLIDRLLRPLLVLGTAVILVLGISSVTWTQGISPDIRQSLSDADTAAAVNLLLVAIKSDPSYHLNYYTLGQIYFERKQYSQAAEQFKLALKRKKKHYESLHHLGLCQLMLGELDAAEKTMKEGQKKSKDHPDWFTDGFGQVMLMRENYQEADKSFRMALASNEEIEAKALKNLKNSPYSDEDRATLSERIIQTASRERAGYHLHLGDANYHSGVPSLAIMEYEKALAVDSGSLEVYFHWAEACLSTKDYACALSKLQIVLSRDSTHAEAWKEMAEIYYKAARSQRKRSDRVARFRDAIGAYQKYAGLSHIQPDSANVRLFFELAMSFSEIKRFEEAAGNYEKVLAIPFEIKDIYYNYGKALWGLKRYKDASETLLKHIEWVSKQDEKYKSNIRDVELYRLLGDSYFYRKPRAYMTAIDYYKISLESKPEQKRLLQNIAIGYHSTKSYVAALEYYDKRIALGLDSNRVNLYRNAGFCAMNIAGGDADDDEFDLDDDEDGDGDDMAVADDNLPVADPNINYFELAIDYLEKYLEHVATDQKVVQVIANTYLYQLADCVNGVTYFEKLLSLDPKNCAANKAIGFAYFGGDICKTNYTKALGYLKKAHSCLLSGEAGVCSDLDITLWIAQCYHLRAAAKQQKDKVAASKDFENAFGWYGKVLKCEPGNTDAKKGQDDTRFEFN